MSATEQTADVARQQALWLLVADDAVDRAMNRLIPQAKNLIEDLFRYPRHRMERNQFTNLVATALETASVAVVLDYVRYQIGRDSGHESWGIGTPSFGAQLLEQLEGLRQTASGLMDNAIREYRIQPLDRAAEEQRLWMQLARRFVGSLHRHFVYYSVLRRREHE